MMKKQTFKFLCLILTFAMVISTACGCQPNNSNNNTSHSSIPNSEVTSSALSSGDANSSTESQPSESFDPERKYGNTVGNLNNSGLAAMQGEWTYYGTKTGVYKIKNDQSKPVRLCENVKGSYINVSGAWVYFIDEISKFIYKVRTDGTGFQQLSDQKVYYLSVVDHWAYYTVNSFGSAIYRTPLDRFAPQELISETIEYFCIYDKIYYGYDLKLYAANLDGSNAVCYGNVATQGILIHDGYKYNSGNLKKEKLDGTNSQTLVPKSAFNIAIEDDWIYYTLNESLVSHKLYKMRIDGTDNQMISRSYCTDISVVGDWIYFNKGVRIRQIFNSATVTLEPYRIKTDGTSLERLD